MCVGTSPPPPPPSLHCRERLQLSTFWQSDALAPHSVTAHFYQRTSVSKVAVYVDYAADESYTPSSIAVKAGTTLSDLEIVAIVQLAEPRGWVHIRLGNQTAMAAAAAAAAHGDADAPSRLGIMDRVTRAHVIMVMVDANHQGGRDTRVRHLRLVGPVDDAAAATWPSVGAAAVRRDGGGRKDAATDAAAAVLAGGAAGAGGGADPWAFDGPLGLPQVAKLSLR